MQPKTLQRKPRGVGAQEDMPIISEYAERMARNPEQYWRDNERHGDVSKPFEQLAQQEERPKPKPLNQPEFQVDTRTSRPLTTKTGLKAVEQVEDREFTKIDYLEEEKEKRAVHEATKSISGENRAEKQTSIPKPFVSPIASSSGDSGRYGVVTDIERETVKPKQTIVPQETQEVTCNQCGMRFGAQDELNRVNFGGKIICSVCAEAEIEKLREMQHQLLSDKVKCEDELVIAEKAALAEQDRIIGAADVEIASRAVPQAVPSAPIGTEAAQATETMDLLRTFPYVLERVMCPCCGDIIETRILGDRIQQISLDGRREILLGQYGSFDEMMAKVEAQRSVVPPEEAEKAKDDEKHENNAHEEQLRKMEFKLDEERQREASKRDLLRKIDNELAAVEFKQNIIDREFGQTKTEKEARDQATLARDLRWNDFIPEYRGEESDRLNLGFRE